VTDGDRTDTKFISRWSERKLQVRRGEQPRDPTDASGPQEECGATAVTTEASESLLTDADMPPLDSLDAHSDYSGFLSRGVSEALRQKALSKLFRSARFNVTDGLDDYAEDFTKFTPLGDVITADLRHRTEQVAERLLEADRRADAAASRSLGDDAGCEQPEDDTATGLRENPTEGEEV